MRAASRRRSHDYCELVVGIRRSTFHSAGMQGGAMGGVGGGRRSMQRGGGGGGGYGGGYGDGYGAAPRRRLG